MKVMMKLYFGFTIFWTAVLSAQSPQTNATGSEQLRLQWQFNTKG
jgi:hypothetical protein